MSELHPTEGTQNTQRKYIIFGVVILMILLIIGNHYHRSLELKSESETVCGTVTNLYEKNIGGSKAIPLRHVVIATAEQQEHIFIVNQFINDKKYTLDKMHLNRQACFVYSLEYRYSRHENAYGYQFPAVIDIYYPNH